MIPQKKEGKEQVSLSEKDSDREPDKVTQREGERGKWDGEAKMSAPQPPPPSPRDTTDAFARQAAVQTGLSRRALIGCFPPHRAVLLLDAPSAVRAQVPASRRT